MRLPFAAFVGAVAAASLGRLAAAQSCCTTDLDCTDMMSAADIEYQSQFDKTLECDQNCPGVVNCNMFGLCEQCRGCFLSCEGALKFMETVSLSADLITFCSGIGVTDFSECEDSISSAGGSGSGSGSGALTGDEGTASGSGSGMNSASSDVSAGYGSGAGAGSVSMSGSSSSSGSGTGSGSGSSSGSSSGSGMGSGSGSSSGSGTGSGSGSLSSSTVTAEGSGEGSRIADIPGCNCGTADVDPSFANYLCTNGKSMYCDRECVDDPDPEDILLPEYGGLWCRPQGWNGCRMCKYDCSEYPDGDCVPCPTGVKDWC